MVVDFVKLAEILGISSKYIWILVLALIWSLIWKALALWKSARKNHLIWFILLLVVNTLGILEILYIFLLSEMKISEHSQNFKFKRNSEVSKIKLEEKVRKRKKQ